jgi:cytoskeletal protein CcmA (bactofilin family)
MFGRRNPDRPPAEPTISPTSDLDELLPDLPNIPATVEREPDQPRGVPTTTPTEPTWYINATAAVATPVTQNRPVKIEPEVLPEPEVPPSIPFTPMIAPSDKPSTGRARSITESVIGPDDFFDGRYRSERGVRIQGNAHGSIESHQYIFVEAGAQVEADLSAEDITIAGSFSGKIACRRRLEVTGSGRVHGHIETSLLVVQEGGRVDGELQMRDAGVQDDDR